MTDLQLTEGAPAVLAELDEEVGDALRRSEIVTSVRVAPGLFEVAATTKVGVVKIADLTIWIKPKVEVNQLLFLMGYAKRPGWLPDRVAMAESGDLLPALAHALADQTERALGQGLLQGYVPTDESLTVLRGRLRDNDQLRQRYGIAVPLLVHFDDYTVDIPENRIVRTAVDQMLRVPGVSAPTRARLRRVRQQLAEVTPLQDSSEIPTWQETRLNERYHVALWLAEVVLRGNAVDQAKGTVRLGGFLIDMARLFEEFLEAVFKRSFTRFGGVVRGQDRHYLDVANEVLMKPDLVWHLDGEPAAVMDAKYKKEKPAGFPDADLYQMLAYCTALQLDDGHLIYAKGNEDELLHTVRHAGVRIHAHTVDLAALPADLLTRIDEIADRVHTAAAVAVG